MTNTDQYTPETDPQHNLRSDLWPTMSIGQLARQQELAIDKISKVHSILGPAASPSMLSIISALQLALNDINNLLDNPNQSRIKK